LQGTKKGISTMSMSDTYTPEYVQANARSYGTGDQERLNAVAILQRFGLGPWVLSRRQRAGWAALSGKPLTSILQRLGSYGRTENTYQTREVEKALSWTPFIEEEDPSAWGWLDESTWRDRQGRRWLTWLGIRKAFPLLPRKSIERWGKESCRFLIERGRRRKIWTAKVRPPTPRVTEKVTIYLEDDVKAVADRMNRDQPQDKQWIEGSARWLRPLIHVDEEGREWLTDVQLIKRYGVTRGFLRWTYKPSRVRAGQKALRSKLVPNPIKQKGSPGEIRVYLGADTQDIIAGKESKYPGSGNGKNAERLRKETAARAKEALVDILTIGYRPTSARLVEEARRRGVGAKAIREAARLYGTYDEDKQNKRRWKLLPGIANDEETRLTAPTGKQSLPPEGPVQPNAFCWNGKVHTIARHLEYALLCQLWTKRRISVEDAICELYGHDADEKDAALMAVVKRLRKFLLQHSLPFEIHVKTAHIIFASFNQN
jgi:hypothetical protein